MSTCVFNANDWGRGQGEAEQPDGSMEEQGDKVGANRLIG